jgi:hypothetical protein
MYVFLAQCLQSLSLLLPTFLALIPVISVSLYVLSLPSALVLCATSNRQIEVLDLAAARTVRRIEDAHAKPGFARELH